jgi:SAM-dependent methyltransferase
MDGSSVGNLRVYPGDAPPSLGSGSLPSCPDPHLLANRELIRPPTYRRRDRELEPFSVAWFDELEQKRYARHGWWLPGALEFGRHPGESVLLIGAGIGSDAARYLIEGSEVTVGLTPGDHPDLLRLNLARHGFVPPLLTLRGPVIPAADGAFDVVAWNALYPPGADVAPLVDELYRVLKAGGKVIGLFPARYDAGYWQDVLLPLQHLYWRRPADPTSAPKTTAKDLRRLFARFGDHRVKKRHLRRSELPHLWRALPLAVLERLIGRVLVVKAFKPLSAARAVPQSAAAADSLAA